MLPLVIRMGVSYRPDDEQVHLAWDIAGITREMLDKGLYICIYKRRNNEDIFRFVRSVNINEITAIDSHMEPGDTAEYRIRVRGREGHLSPYSNVVQVTVPADSETNE